MKYFIVLFLLFSLQSNAQYISSFPNNYTDDQLVEDVLFGTTGCVENIQVTNTVSGVFNENTKSYGYFEQNNSDFPFESGIVMSTGKLYNVDGPNDHLSDDDGNNWIGDQDLENAVGLNAGETTNATILQFEFTPKAENLSFRYIFASEEYQEFDRNTCRYSDAFAFLIRKVGTQDYQNIAVVPETTIPVSVTTVHPAIDVQNGCPAENEAYFGQFNDYTSATNFNGQTAVLTAKAQVEADQAYEIKLVIADDTNYRYDSAVFLEADSFNIGSDLGYDLVGDSALCIGESHTLSLSEENENSIVRWYYEGSLIPNENASELEISEADFGAGNYKVEVEIAGGCTATDEIEVEFYTPNFGDFELIQCEANQGDSIFDLNLISDEIESLNLNIINFFEEEIDAENNVNPILEEDISSFSAQNNTRVYILVETVQGCETVINLDLLTTLTEYNPLESLNCVDENNNVVFNILDLENFVIQENNLDFEDHITFFNTHDDAANNINSIDTEEISYPLNTLPQEVFYRVDDMVNCTSVSKITLNDIESPILETEEQNLSLCLNIQDSIELIPNITNPNSNFVYEWDTGETTPTIEVNEAGTYIVDIFSSNASESCMTTQMFNVSVSEKAEIDYELRGAPGNFSIEIIASGIGDYVYALNDGDFQESPIFNVRETDNTIYVKDLNGCGTVSLGFKTILFPDFFTPNNDGYNDIWSPKGTAQQIDAIKTIHIHDRYGKILYIINEDRSSWNGDRNGHPMPSNDYWYRVEFKDGSVYSDHFTLKR
ncbi:MAG: choice-of-anchor L domain-containing protein [Psychroflexus halocasei]